MDLTSSTVVRSLRGPRRRGFPADLPLGFYLYARERMTYVRGGQHPTRFGWFVHRFVAFDGRLIQVSLPPKARLFVWPAGQGPRPVDSVAPRTSVWGRVPSMSLNVLSSAELHRVYNLWRQFGSLPDCRQTIDGASL